MYAVVLITDEATGEGQTVGTYPDEEAAFVAANDLALTTTALVEIHPATPDPKG